MLEKQISEMRAKMTFSSENSETKNRRYSNSKLENADVTSISPTADEVTKFLNVLNMLD